jgi:UDP:flavonoid glycosyltransferase YjiC (YdhE family)
LSTDPFHDAIETVLADPSYRERARALAEELRAQPPVDDAVPLLESLARS